MLEYFLYLKFLLVGFLLFWLGVGGIVALLVSLAIDNILIQTAVFVLVSTILLIITKPFVNKFITKNSDTIVTNAYTIIGKEGIVIQKIDGVSGTGQVKIDSEVWSAKTQDNTIINEGEKIEVVNLEGVKAIVKVASIVNV